MLRVRSETGQSEVRQESDPRQSIPVVPTLSSQSKTRKEEKANDERTITSVFERLSRSLGNRTIDTAVVAEAVKPLLKGNYQKIAAAIGIDLTEYQDEMEFCEINILPYGEMEPLGQQIYLRLYNLLTLFQGDEEMEAVLNMHEELKPRWLKKDEEDASKREKLEQQKKREEGDRREPETSDLRQPSQDDNMDQCVDDLDRPSRSETPSRNPSFEADGSEVRSVIGPRRSARLAPLYSTQSDIQTLDTPLVDNQDMDDLRNTRRSESSSSDSSESSQSEGRSEAIPRRSQRFAPTCSRQSKLKIKKMNSKKEEKRKMKRLLLIIIEKLNTPLEGRIIIGEEIMEKVKKLTYNNKTRISLSIGSTPYTFLKQTKWPWKEKYGKMMYHLDDFYLRLLNWLDNFNDEEKKQVIKLFKQLKNLWRKLKRDQKKAEKETKDE